MRGAQDFFGSKVETYRQSASHANQADLSRMVGLIAPRAGARALDVATGGGHTARALADAGCRVVATDVARPMLAAMPDTEARARVVADAQALPFRDGAFDVVASRIAPHHFADLGAFVREAARVLATGGALYAFDLTSPDDAAAARVVNEVERLRDPSHAWSHSAAAWRAAVEGAGLAIERLESAASEFPLEPWLARAQMPAHAEQEVRRLLREHAAGQLGGYGLVGADTMRVLRVELLARRT